MSATAFTCTEYPDLKLVKRLVIMTLVAVIIVAAGVVFIARIDFTRFARTIEAEIEAETGREIEIKGQIEANLLSLEPEVVLNDVRLANPGWTRDREMARIKRVKIVLRLLPSLTGRLEIKRLVLHAPDIRLETDENGRGNWELGKAVNTSEAVKLGGSWVKHLSIEQGRIVFRRAASDDITDIRLASLAISADGPASPLRVSAAGSLGGRRFRVKARAGRIADILGGKEIPIQFDVGYGESSLEGRLKVRNGDTFTITGTVTGARVDLRESALRNKASSRSPRTRPLPVHLLRSVSGALKLSARRLQLDAFEAKHFKADVSFAAGVISVKPMTASLLGGRLAGDLRLDASTEPARLAVKLALSGADLAKLGQITAIDRPMKGQIQAGLAANVTGNTIAALEAALRPIGLAVTMRNARVANASWAGQPDMIRVKRIEASINLGALLDDRLHVIRLTAVEPDIRLETDRKGRGNWVVGSPSSSDSKGWSWPRIDAVRIDRGQVLYKDRAAGMSHSIRLDRVNMASTGARSLRRRFEIAGSVDGKRISAKGTVGALSALAAGKATPLAFNATLGKSDLSGKLTIVRGDRLDVRGNLSSNRLDVGDPSPPRSSKKPLLSDDPIPLTTLRSLSGQLSVKAKQIIIGGQRILGLTGAVVLASGRLTVSRVSGTIAKGKLSGRFTMDARTARPRMELRIDVKRAVLGEVLGATPGPATPDDLLDFSLKAKGQGRSLRAVAATLDGSTTLLLGRGRIEEAAGVFLDLGSGILSSIASFAKIKGGAIRCAAFRVELRDGIGRSTIMLIDTQRLTFVGHGTINFKTNTVDAIFYPRNKVPLMRLVKPYSVRIRGPIQQPKTETDMGAAAARSAKNIAGLVKLPFNLGRSLFGGGKSGAPPFDPCPSAVAATKQKLP